MKNIYLLMSVTLFILTTSCSSIKHRDTIPPIIGSQALYENTWELEYMSGTDTSIEALFPDRTPFLKFDDLDNMVRGNAGCNGYSATFTKEGDNISFGDPGPSTMMYCGEGEQQFLNTMEKINRYSIDENGKLNLKIDEIPFLRFKKVEQQ